MAAKYKNIIACYPNTKHYNLMVALAEDEGISLSRLIQGLISDKIKSLSPEKLEQLEKSVKE